MDSRIQVAARRKKTAGFSLVEVALALMVVSIGLVALVGLLPASLDMNKKAIDDTQMGFLGEDIMNGYRCALLTQRWEDWDDIVIGGTASNLWDDTVNINVTLGKTSVVYQIISPQRSGPDIEIQDVVARTDLDVDIHPTVGNGTLLACRLELNPGEFGPTNSIVFYTEMYSTDLTW